MIRMWREAGFTADEADAWWRAGCSFAMAVWGRSKGLTPEETARRRIEFARETL